MNESAEVRPAKSLAQFAAQLREMHKEHIRTTLEQSRNIGSVLRAAKEQCVREGKAWLPFLEESKINRRTASQHMRISEKWSLLVDHGYFASHGGVAEAINYLAGNCADEEELNTRPKSTNPAAGMAPPPPMAAVRCVDCIRKGRSGLNCEACKELNQGRPKKPPTPPPEAQSAREEHGPGADDGDVDVLYAKYEEARLKAVSGPLIREIRKIAHTYGLKAPEPKRPWQPVVPFDEWFAGFDTRFKPIMRKLWDARNVLRDLLHTLEEEKAKGGLKDAELPD